MAGCSNSGHDGTLLFRFSISVIFVMVTTVSVVPVAATVHSRSDRYYSSRVRRFRRALIPDPSLHASRNGNNYSNCQYAGCSDATQICCSGACVDVFRSSQSCGACNNQCAYNRECCTGVCVDTHASDPSNCGTCGAACPAGVPCLFGMCGYSSGRIP